MITSKNMNTSKKQQIRNLLLVVFSGIFLAASFSLLLLYKYNPSDHYEISNILLAPDMMEGLKFNDTNPKTGGQSRYVFDRIEFENKKISQDQYQIFYQMIAANKSLDEVSEEVKNFFNRGRPAKLKIWMKTESNASWQYSEKVFQELEFARQGDYYRVSLRETGNGNAYNYAYFFTLGIYKQVQELFAQDEL